MNKVKKRAAAPLSIELHLRHFAEDGLLRPWVKELMKNDLPRRPQIDSGVQLSLLYNLFIEALELGENINQVRAIVTFRCRTDLGMALSLPIEIQDIRNLVEALVLSNPDLCKLIKLPHLRKILASQCPPSVLEKIPMNAAQGGE